MPRGEDLWGLSWRPATTERLSAAENILLQGTQYATKSGLSNKDSYILSHIIGSP